MSLLRFQVVIPVTTSACITNENLTKKKNYDGNITFNSTIFILWQS